MISSDVRISSVLVITSLGGGGVAKDLRNLLLLFSLDHSYPKTASSHPKDMPSRNGNVVINSVFRGVESPNKVIFQAYTQSTS